MQNCKWRKIHLVVTSGSPQSNLCTTGDSKETERGIQIYEKEEIPFTENMG